MSRHVMRTRRRFDTCACVRDGESRCQDSEHSTVSHGRMAAVVRAGTQALTQLFHQIEGAVNRTVS